MTGWYLYIVRTQNGSLYTGVTTDISRRLDEHRNSKKGAKFLRSKGPLQLVYHQPMGNRAHAQKMEYHIKQLPKHQKERLILAQPNPQDLWAWLESEFKLMP